MKNLKQYIQENRDRFIDELFEILKIPSISADPKYKEDVLKCAELVKNKLIISGAENVKLCQTDGYPIVYADKIIDKNLPTVLVYGHYDVQPDMSFLEMMDVLNEKIIEENGDPTWS